MLSALGLWHMYNDDPLPESRWLCTFVVVLVRDHVQEES